VTKTGNLLLDWDASWIGAHAYRRRSWTAGIRNSRLKTIGFSPALTIGIQYLPLSGPGPGNLPLGLLRSDVDFSQTVRAGHLTGPGGPFPGVGLDINLTGSLGLHRGYRSLFDHAVRPNGQWRRRTPHLLPDYLQPVSSTTLIPDFAETESIRPGHLTRFPCFPAEARFLSGGRRIFEFGGGGRERPPDSSMAAI